MRRIGPLGPPEIWPGFRPDTLAVVLSTPEVGWLLSGWLDFAPDGFSPVPLRPFLAWRPYRQGAPEDQNTISLEGHPWIFYRASGSRAVDLGNLVHEAFHLFERELRPAGDYPPGENSFRVVSYPEFSAENEAGLALEGRLLAAALDALPDTAGAAALTRSFVAVREARHRLMAPDDALFEIRTELNEGVAQYAYVRALELVADDPGIPWADEARLEAHAQRNELRDLIARRRQSARLRFYLTGLGQALLLDALAGPSWKLAVMERGASLPDLLAEASGYRVLEEQLVEGAEREYGDRLDSLASAAVERLQAERMSTAAEAMTAPGARIEVDVSALPGGDVGFCGLDPQNLLQTGDGRLLHARWFRACAPGFDAEFNTPVLHDREAGTLELVAAPEASLEVLVDGRPLSGPDSAPARGELRIRGSGVTLEADGAEVRWVGGALQIVVHVAG
ncbi:MAG: hypothetical protein ABFS34_15865 [Gemmatimonadota bacterium]